MADTTAPYCPTGGKAHGRLLRATWSKDPTGWYCPHDGHRKGSTSRFTDKEAHGDYELTGEDMTAIYEQAARDVIAGRTTLDAAVTEVARSTKRASSQVREAMVVMIETLEQKKPEPPKPKPAPRSSGHRLERTGGDKFAEVIARHGLTKSQAAEATGAAGLGSSSTYIYILTHDGASSDLFVKFEAAIRDYAKKQGRKKP